MKPTYQLIILLIVALAVFVGYSKMPDYIADAVHLKQIGQNTVNTNDINITNDNSDTTNDTIQTEPTDTTKQRLLLFGDSMSQLLALRLSDYANHNGHRLTCVTWNGSGTRQWALTDTLNYYMNTLHPTHVFICLGSNELYSADMKNIRRRAEMIVAKIGNVPFTWIGPPNWMEDKGINNMLQSELGKHHFFMTRGMKLNRQEDGRHPTHHGGAVWMDSIVTWMNTGKAIHPFRLEKPTKRNTHYRQIFLGEKPKTEKPTEKADSTDNVSPTELSTAETSTEKTNEEKTEDTITE